MRYIKVSCLPAGASLLLLIIGTLAWGAPVHSPAYLSFSADKTEYVEGERALLSWASTNTKFCQASGDWSGKLDTEGSYRTPALDTSKSYGLKCMAPGGGIEQIVEVIVMPASEPEPVPEPDPEPAPTPTLSFTAADSSIVSGGATTLSWSTTDATSCAASGGWSGSKAVSGSEPVAPTSDTTYSLTCDGEGGSVSASVAVAVEPALTPTLSFTAADESVVSGDSTTLTWTAADVDSCTASGGWSGARAESGNEQVGPIIASTTFSLSCSGAGGSVVEMLSVGAIGEIGVGWDAPTQNVDGSPLTDLAGFRIYYGDSSGAYANMIEVTDPAAVSHTLSLLSGSYFIAMTAVDTDGNESAHSNEISRTLP